MPTDPCKPIVHQIATRLDAAASALDAAATVPSPHAFVGRAPRPLPSSVLQHELAVR